MTKLSAHQSNEFVKIMYIGDSSTGKTGSLASLAADGYEFMILDLDNGLDVLKNFVTKECPDKLDNIDYETLRDKIKGGNIGVTVTAKAFVETTKLLNKWSDERIPAEFGPKGIVVLDSLTTLGKSAFEWARSMNPTAKDPRQWYFAAQQAVENMIALLTSAEFRANVIIISHINYKELQDGTTKGYPSAIGSALGPIIPKYFNTLVMADKVGSGTAVKRKIKTVSTAIIDLKTPAPFKIDKEYDLGDGMSKLFKELKSI